MIMLECNCPACRTVIFGGRSFMKKKIIPVLFVLVLIILIGAVAVGLWLKEKYSYSNEVLDLQEYFQVKNGERAILLGNDRL